MSYYSGRKPSKEKLELVFRYQSVAATGRYYGVSAYVVTKWLKEYKIPKPVRRKPLKPHKEELEHLYTAQGKSIVDCGRELDCSVYMIRKGLKEYKIAKRQIPGCEKRTIAPRLRKNPTIEDRLIKTRRKSTCGMLKDHARELKDDPERLSTEFLQKIIGVNCEQSN